MRSNIVSGLLWITFAGSITGWIGTSCSHSQAEKPMGEAPINSETASQVVSVGERGSFSLIMSSDYYPDLEIGLGAGVNRQGVYFSTDERDPFTGTWFSERTFLSTAYAPYEFAAISGTVFCVIGKAGADDIVQLWRVRHSNGAYVADRPLSSGSPIGTPLVTPPLTIHIRGGSYIPPTQRQSPLVLRQAVYRGQDLGGFRAVAADPDGRFLLALGENNPGLYRIRVAGGDVDLVLDAATLPYLADALHINVLRDAALGRVYVIRAAGLFNGLMAVLAFDTENDGIIDYTELLDEAAYEASVLLDYPAEDFLSY